MKQCTCGRSKSYPYCDNTHKIKKQLLLSKYEQCVKEFIDK
jgi:CDGSH-type Zn-finger protein